MFVTLLKSIVATSILLMIAGTSFISAYTLRLYRNFEVPSKNYLLHVQSQGVTMFDATGQKFFSLNSSGHRDPLPYQKIPPAIVQALVAAEDRTFFTHPGISAIGIVRAAYLDWQYKKFLYGGSTITQQLTKTILLHPEKDLMRKYHEAIYAFKIDQTFSKEDIIEIYLNNAYFGEQAYGIEAAAQTYFGKPATELTLSEGTLLVGLLPAPTTLSPISGNLNLARQRQRYVLQQMAEENFLTADAATQAWQQPLAFAASQPPTNAFAHHFALAVYESLQNKFTREYLDRAGLNVYTTLDPAWQKEAEQALQTQLPVLKKRRATNGAIVIIDVKNRAVKAMVGSVDWYQPNFGKMNMAVTPRQTGSAFKPIVYAAALESGQITAASILNDKPTTFGKDYKPENYDRRYRGRVTVRYALANSLNIPAVDVTNTIGPSRVAAMGKRLGINSLSPDASSNLSIALGTEEISLLELTNTYANFADQGQYQPPQLITHLFDKFGQAVPWENDPKRRVLQPATAFIISSILSDNQVRRQTFGNTLVTHIPSASKTGTTQKFRDAWTVGYTPTLAVGVWVGNNDFTPMANAPGATTSAPIWRQLINSLSQPATALAFNQPANIIEKYVCPRYGLLASPQSGGVPEYFLPGTEPTRPCPLPPPSPSPSPNPDETATNPANLAPSPAAVPVTLPNI